MSHRGKGIARIEAEALPGFKTADITFMTYPTNPIAEMPMRHIFIESQSSLLPGLIASFNVLAH
jgi:hypothetical protein